MMTPCNPSAPPVKSLYLLANSSKMSAVPKVTIRRVKSLPRMMESEHAAPNNVAAPIPTAKPNKGSGHMCLAKRAAVYAPKPKNAAWPKDTIPV